MTRDLHDLLPVALAAADTARDLIRTTHPATVTEKADRDLVSDVDVAVERAVRSYLHQATPRIDFLGEEEGGPDDRGTGWLWALDPIDGTSNFAHGIPLCATSLALLQDGRPVLGVIIHAPLLGERCHAAEGHGAWCEGRRLSASRITALRDAIVAIGDYATGPEAARRNETQLAATVQLTPRVRRIRMLGTAALDLAWVAAGRLDASITFSNHPWDTAAGVIIAREAGAAVTDSDGSPHNLASAATIAAPARLIPQLVPLIQPASMHDAHSPDTQMTGASPYADLDTVLSRARYLIFEFDGPICDLSAAMPGDTTRRLREILDGACEALPSQTCSTDSPVGILAAAAGSPGVAARIDDQITGIEATAAATAAPAGYIYKALAACRDSGRITAVIASTSTSTQIVTGYHARHGLDDQVRQVTALDGHPPGHLQTVLHLLEDSIRALGVTPADCALITASDSGIQTGRDAGVPTVGYAATPDASKRLAEAGADSLLTSLADLTLRLRARPLPN